MPFASGKTVLPSEGSNEEVFVAFTENHLLRKRFEEGRPGCVERVLYFQDVHIK